MRRARYRQSIDPVPFAHLQLWLAAVLLFGVADLAVVAFGLGLDDLLGAGVAAAPLLSGYGPSTVVAAKLGAFVGCYALWRLLPQPYRVAGPVGLALVGTTLAAWRILVVTATLLA